MEWNPRALATTHVSPRRLCVLAVGVAVAHLAVTIAAPGSAAAGWLINAAFVSGALLALWRATSSRSDRAAWVCIGAALLCQAFGDRYYKLFLADAAHVSQPSVADVGYLAFYPLAACAIVLLLRARLPSLTRALVLDAREVAHPAPAHGVDRPVVDDAEQPRAHRAARAVVAAGGAPGRQERLLGDVLGRGPAAHHPVGQGEGAGAVALVDHGERVGVAAPHQLHQLLVG